MFGGVAEWVVLDASKRTNPVRQIVIRGFVEFILEVFVREKARDAPCESVAG